MKRIVLCGVCLIIATVLLSAELAQDYPMQAAWSISYDHAGLQHIEVTSGSRCVLSYTYCQLRKSAGDAPEVYLQSMRSYDKHTHTIYLTTREAEAFRNWIDTSGISALPKSFPSQSKETYGSAFQNRLSVMVGTDRIGRGWTGDDIVPPALGKAIESLHALAVQVRNDRLGFTAKPK